MIILLKQNNYTDRDQIDEIKEAIKSGDKDKIRELKKKSVNNRGYIYSGVGALVGANKTRKKWNNEGYDKKVKTKVVRTGGSSLSTDEFNRRVKGQKITDAIARSVGRGAIGFVAGRAIGRSKFNHAYKQAERELATENVKNKLVDRIVPPSSDKNKNKNKEDNKNNK